MGSEKGLKVHNMQINNNISKKGSVLSHCWNVGSSLSSALPPRVQRPEEKMGKAFHCG